MSDDDKTPEEAAAPEAPDGTGHAVVRRDGGARVSNLVLIRLIIFGFFIAAVAIIWQTNGLLTDRFSETTRNRADVRLALFTGNVMSELQRNSVVPLLLARDPALISSLNSGDFSATSQRLISAQSEIGAASIMLLDASGRVVAATDRTRITATLAQRPAFVDAVRSKDTVFTVSEREGGSYEFSYSRSVVSENHLAGVIIVGVELAKFERVLTGIAEAVAVVDSENTVILATEPRWRGKSLADALAGTPPATALERALQATSDWTTPAADAYVGGEAVIRNEARIPFRGWRLVSFTTYT